MLMLPHHVDVRPDPDGHPVVEVTYDLTAAQVAAGAHAVRIVREARHRTQEMSTDDVLAMRELTSIADELAVLEVHAAAATLRASPARLGAFRDALETFASGEHVEREGDAAARPVVFALADGVADLHAEAIRAALGDTAHSR
jgi:hypothetical protein